MQLPLALRARWAAGTPSDGRAVSRFESPPASRRADREEAGLARSARPGLPSVLLLDPEGSSQKALLQTSFTVPHRGDSTTAVVVQSQPASISSLKQMKSRIVNAWSMLQSAPGWWFFHAVWKARKSRMLIEPS